MEDLQFEDTIDWLLQHLHVDKGFTISYINPVQLDISEKMKFDCLFDLPSDNNSVFGDIY